MKVETVKIEDTTVEFYDDYINVDYQTIFNEIEIIAENTMKKISKL